MMLYSAHHFLSVAINNGGKNKKSMIKAIIMVIAAIIPKSELTVKCEKVNTKNPLTKTTEVIQIATPTVEKA